MKSVLETHLEHREIESEINFLLQEIQFFTKILNKQYAVSINAEKVKVLDAYWRQFEKYKERLENLKKVVIRHEQEIALLCKEGLADAEKTKINDEKSEYKELYHVSKEMKTFKESFFNYMMQQF